MNSIFPIIRISDLQRKAKEVLSKVKDYAVIRSHSNDVALVLHPKLGKALMESPFFRTLLEEVAKRDECTAPVDMQELDRLIGRVLNELSRK